jgi:4,5-DOPA dioxygenase extradiol
MYEHDHPAYRKLQEIGREITTKVKPKAVVVFSGHWQAGRDTIEVNTAEITDLIYEYAIPVLLPYLDIVSTGDC